MDKKNYKYLYHYNVTYTKEDTFESKVAAGICFAHDLIELAQILQDMYRNGIDRLNCRCDDFWGLPLLERENFQKIREEDEF